MSRDAALPQAHDSLQSLFPVFDQLPGQIVALVACTILLFVGSELLLRLYVKKYPSSDDDATGKSSTTNQGAGRIIGKCENVIIFVMVCMGNLDGLGLVLAAKSIARMDAMKNNPSHYLGGTLLNFVWSLLCGLLARLLVFAPQ